jgi:hypothetical protein
MPASPNPSNLSPVPPKAHSPRSPPVPHFEDPPDPQDEHPDSHQADDAAFDADDEIPYPEPTSEQTLLPPPNFNPFFTIVEDTTTGDHHHPFVHYVFADDDPVIVTAAAMRSLGLDDTKYLPQPDEVAREQLPDDGEEDEENQEPVVESPLPPPIVGSKERFMIIDIAADGHTIVGAQSMSPDWQITNANVRTAPSFDEGAPDRGYMLKIEGVEVPGKNKGKSKGQPGENKLREAQERSQGDIFGALDGLVKGIEGSLEVAGKISGRDEEVRESGQTAIRTDDAEADGSRRGSRVE